jgi:hypothetical protein
MKTLFICLPALAVLLTGCVRDHMAEVRPHGHPYHKPMVSPGTKFAGLPRAAQDAIRAQAGSQEIVDIVREERAGAPIYTVFFRNDEVFPPLLVSAEGDVLNPDLTVAVGAPRETIGVATGGAASGLTLGDLPPDVVRAIQERVPTTEVAHIEKLYHGERVVYGIVFRNGAKHPTLYINEDGTLLHHSR